MPRPRKTGANKLIGKVDGTPSIDRQAERLELLARQALTEVTPPETVGLMLDQSGEEAITIRFAANLAGYPDWYWSVTLAQLLGEQPTVIETHLLPGNGAVLAPPWVPWSERMEEFHAAQAAAAARNLETSDDDDLDEDDLDDDTELPDLDDPDDTGNYLNAENLQESYNKRLDQDLNINEINEFIPDVRNPNSVLNPNPTTNPPKRSRRNLSND